MSARSRSIMNRLGGPGACVLAVVGLAILAVALDLVSWPLAAALSVVSAAALLGHVPFPAALASFGAALFAVLAFVVEESGPRPFFGGAAVVCAVAYGFISWRARRRAGHPASRLGRVVGLVASSALALGGALIGIAFIAGRLIAERTEPIPFFWMYVGLILLAAGFFVLVYWWARSFERAEGRRPRFLRAFLFALLALTVAVVALERRDIPNEKPREDRNEIREAGGGRFDLLLAIDPADPLSRQLIRAARKARKPTAEDPFGFRGQHLFPRRAHDPAYPGLFGPPYDVAMGLAVAQPRDGRQPVWRLVEPPTTDFIELAQSLAQIRLPPPGRPTAPTSYGRLLRDAANRQERVRWRDGTKHAVAFVLDRLPSLRELDGRDGGDAIPVGSDPGDACTKFAHDREHADEVEDPSKIMPWGDALHVLCDLRATHRIWLEAGQPAQTRPRPLALYAVTQEQRRGRIASWTAWTGALGGSVHSRPAQAGTAGLLQDAQGAYTGQPVGDLAYVANAFRPHLFFDENEEFYPVDVDWLLSATGRPSRRMDLKIRCDIGIDLSQICKQVSPRSADDTHRVCDRETLDDDNCEPISGPLGLATSLDEFIDFEGRARGGRDVPRGGKEPPRMYVHVREEKEIVEGKEETRLYLGYWWFFRYNVSPWRTEVNCLPGLSFGGLSCHDHEGDWEGITVVLQPLDHPRARDPHVLGNLDPKGVIYEAHGRQIGWEWPAVKLAADNGSYATHPIVYVATGSHASYPAGCAKTECDQRLSRRDLGDGGFDGRREWRYNNQRRCAEIPLVGDARRFEHDIAGPCLLPLPTIDSGHRGVLWNAFPGTWGGAECTVVARVCSLVDGPPSPSRQKRFQSPNKYDTGPRKVLDTYEDNFKRAARPQDASGPPRWPPEQWPIPDNERPPQDAQLPD